MLRRLAALGFALVTSLALALPGTSGRATDRTASSPWLVYEPAPHDHVCPYHGVEGTRRRLPDPEVLNGLADCYDLPIVVNRRVRSWIRHYQRMDARSMRVWLERSGRYAPIIRAELARHDLPRDLMYLAMAESGFENRARSPMGAVGPWQFMRVTAREYGIEPDWWEDPRRDPERSTAAAADHLQRLYDEFGDWYLVAAAYNAGAGRVQGAMRRAHSRDYWRVRRYLPEETREYVPRVIALALIAGHPELFGFHDLEFDYAPLTEDFYAPGSLSLGAIAHYGGISGRELRELNPAERRGCTAPDRITRLRVPLGTVAQLRHTPETLDVLRASCKSNRRGTTR